MRQSGAGYVVVQPWFEADESRRGEDLKISKDLAALAASATAREMNNLGRGPATCCPAQHSRAMGAATAGVAATSALSMGDRARTYLESLRAWLKGPASCLGLEIYPPIN